MAKLYSEKLNKYFTMDEMDLLEKEEAEFDAKKAEEEKKKANKEARLHEVEDAYDAAFEAYNKAIQLKDKFVEDYGSIKLKRSYVSESDSTNNPGFGIANMFNSLYDLFDL